MTAAEFPPGIDAEVWEEVDKYRIADSLVSVYHDNRNRYFVLREPTPTMPVLPIEPGAVIRATIHGRQRTLHNVGIGWCFTHNNHLAPVNQITAWEPLLTRSEWAESVGVEEFRQARDRWQRDVDLDSLDEAVIDFLARVDGAS